MWSPRIRTVIEGKGLSGVVFGTEKGSSKNDLETLRLYRDKEKSATVLIVTALGSNPLRSVQSAQTPVEMWRTLNAICAANKL